MSEIEIILSEQINSDLGSRNKIEELYQSIPNDISKVVMNFKGVEFFTTFPFAPLLGVSS